DVHEIAIALIIDDAPGWTESGIAREDMLRILVEAVVLSLTFEMATQDFCDFMIEELLAEGYEASDSLLGFAAVAGLYLVEAENLAPLPAETETGLTHVMAREALLHN